MIDWAYLKTISEVLKNGAEAAGVFGAVFLYYKWLNERRDRSTQVLFELESRFGDDAIQKGKALVEVDERYCRIRRALIEAALPPDPARDISRELGSGWADAASGLAQIDALLRFYILLLGVRRAGQVPDSSLAACYRYWLAHYFHPSRREFRIYIAQLFPTLHCWLNADRHWWRRLRRKTFFHPEPFRWYAGRRFKGEFLRRAAHGRVLVITGAGISAASGIPTYRDPEGLWRRYNPYQLATRAAFLRDPVAVWNWYRGRRDQVRQAQPSLAHRLLLKIEAEAGEFLLLTQNVDDLHERAGTKPEHLVKIHGSILLDRCSVDESHLVGSEGPLDQADPRCHQCGARLRPGVVWFDEEYEPEQKKRVQSFLEQGACDLVVVIGTTAAFADIVDWAVGAVGETGCLVEINPHETYLSPAADAVLRKPADVGVCDLVGKVCHSPGLPFRDLFRPGGNSLAVGRDPGNRRV